MEIATTIAGTIIAAVIWHWVGWVRGTNAAHRTFDVARYRVRDALSAVVREEACDNCRKRFENALRAEADSPTRRPSARRGQPSRSAQ